MISNMSSNFLRTINIKPNHLLYPLVIRCSINFNRIISNMKKTQCKVNNTFCSINFIINNMTPRLSQVNNLIKAKPNRLNSSRHISSIQHT